MGTAFPQTRIQLRIVDVETGAIPLDRPGEIALTRRKFDPEMLLQ